jgi:hypothetical protein
MKYTKTIDLWAPGIQEQILNGSLRVQTGQWVRCGSEKLSRFVRSTGRSLWVAHPQGSSSATKARWQDLLMIYK